LSRAFFSLIPPLSHLLPRSGTGHIFLDIPLRNVSYCQDDRRNNNIMAFIAKETPTSPKCCFAFKSYSQANEIMMAIGDAFSRAKADGTLAAGAGYVGGADNVADVVPAESCPFAHTPPLLFSPAPPSVRPALASSTTWGLGLPAGQPGDRNLTRERTLKR
jgi:hypothetical protein